MKILAIFLVIFLIAIPVIANVVLRNIKKDEEGFDLIFSHDHQASHYLRQTFDFYSNNYLSSKSDVNFSNVSKKQAKMMKEKFIVLKVEEGDFGGYFLTIVLSPKDMPHKLYRWNVWIYDIGGNNEEFEIRYLNDSPITKKHEAEFLPLKSEENLQYWM